LTILWDKYCGSDISSRRRASMYPPQQSTRTIRVQYRWQRNGKTSSSNRTRHLNVRYFFVTDKIKKGEVKVAYCPTQDMLGDFFTKPLQVTQFVQMRSKILNLPSSSSTAVHRSVLGKSKDSTGNVERLLTTRLNSRLKNNKAIICGGDGNSKL